MSQLIGKRAVVIGAGMGGLAASAALAPFFERVVVLERDELPSAAVPRAGVPQGKQLHVLLGSGQRALEALCPGLEADLLHAGAVRYRAGLDLWLDRPGFDPFPRRDAGWNCYALSRPLLEALLRARVVRGNVELRAGCRVERILLSDDGARVSGIEHGTARGTQTLSAELVIDASGRAAPTLAALRASGLPAPRETRIGVDLGYATQLFQMPAEPPSEWKLAVCYPEVPSSSRAGLLLPIEGRRWMATLGGRLGEKPPGDAAGFSDFLHTLRTPTIARALRQAQPLGEITRFGFPESIWRHFEQIERLPAGLLPLGDAICQFNPIYGQGMSVAALEAQLLARALGQAAAAREPVAALAGPYLAELPALLEGPWQLSAIPDFAFPDTRGERPPHFLRSLKFLGGLVQLAAREPSVQQLMLEVQHLLRPYSALSDPELEQRILGS
jgi:2-polyprenyl-6-methoxyphenol hydroxylase-like FAD-dependent oxidoreductase